MMVNKRLKRIFLCMAIIFAFSTFSLPLDTAYAASDNANLSDITLDGGSVQGFDANTLTYDINVDWSATETTIAATAEDVNATVSGDTGTQPLSVGLNTFTVTCTAEDGVAKKDYVLNITRAAASTDATLSDLNTDGHTVQGFASDTYTYDMTVGYTTEQVNIGATATDTNAQISGDTGVQSLSYGLNEFTITCTAEDGTATQDYVFNITRENPVITTADSIVFDKSIGTITGYTGSATDLEIPSSIESIVVVSIGNGAFEQKASLISVTIPDSVTSIGHGAFKDCIGLKTVTVVGNRLETIGSGAFWGCTDLSSINLPDSITTLGDGMFIDCSSLSSITIPQGVPMIDDSFFNNCIGLMSVTIPDSIWYIGISSFYNCAALTSITIPSSVTNIATGAFDSHHPSLIIRGIAGSTAETYANANGITFEAIGSDATLSDLTIDSSTVQGFVSNTYTYDITVGYSTGEIEVGATATDTNAQITGDTGTQSLSVGLNTLTVTCTAEDGTTTQDYTLNITREAAPQKIALLFGMADYVGTDNDLNGPVNDMIAMQAVLEHAGYTVHKYMNYSAANVLSTIEATAASLAANDTLLFAYSGHGADGGYLIGADGYGISIANLESMLSLHAGVKEVIIDACYSGDFIGKGIESKSFVKLDSEKAFNDYVISVFKNNDSALTSKSLAESGYYVMTACSGAQISYEFPFIIPNSPFAANNLIPYNYNDETYYILGYFNIAFHDGFGLYNSTAFSTMWADSNSDDTLTWDELYQYVANGTNSKQQSQVYPLNSTHEVYYSSGSGASALQSFVYTIDQANSIVSDVADLTTIADFKANFSNDATQIKVYNTSGGEVTSGYVGTGMTVKLVIGGTVEDELEVCVLGDVSGDGVIDIIDYTMVRLDIFNVSNLVGAFEVAGDVNSDNVIDIIDYTLIRLDIFDIGHIN